MIIDRSTNKIVDDISEIHLSGNIVPNSWWMHIKTNSGKPYDKAITILSEIVYWYRRTEIQDEATGQTIGYKRKFMGDKLQRSYGGFADKFGYTKREVKAAIDHLVVAGLIKTEFRTINVQGVAQNNVLFIEPIPQKIKEISHPPTSKRNRLLHPNVGGSYAATYHPPTLKRRTNTKTKTETIPETTTAVEVEPLLEQLPRELQLDREVRSFVTDALMTRGEEYVISNIQAALANSRTNPKAFLRKALSDDYGELYRAKRRAAEEKAMQAAHVGEQEKKKNEVEIMELRKARMIFESLPAAEKEQLLAAARHKISPVTMPQMVEAAAIEIAMDNYCIPAMLPGDVSHRKEQMR